MAFVAFMWAVGLTVLALLSFATAYDLWRGEAKGKDELARVLLLGIPVALGLVFTTAALVLLFVAIGLSLQGGTA